MNLHRYFIFSILILLGISYTARCMEIKKRKKENFDWLEKENNKRPKQYEQAPVSIQDAFIKTINDILLSRNSNKLSKLQMTLEMLLNHPDIDSMINKPMVTQYGTKTPLQIIAYCYTNECTQKKANNRVVKLRKIIEILIDNGANLYFKDPHDNNDKSAMWLIDSTTSGKFFLNTWKTSIIEKFECRKKAEVDLQAKANLPKKSFWDVVMNTPQNIIK